jgi:hypothetical protein
MSNPVTSPHHTPQQHGRHHDYEGATEPRGPKEGQPQTPAKASAPSRRNEGVENPPEPESQPDGFGEPDEPEHTNDEDGSSSGRPSKRRPTKSPAPSDPLR